MIVCLLAMKRNFFLFLLLSRIAHGHDIGSEGHTHKDHLIKPSETVVPEWYLIQAKIEPADAAEQTAKNPPALASVFTAFAPRVKVRWDETYLFVETSGLPEHGLMKGITNWQQQVPVPQSYLGANAWQIPLVPVPAKLPLSIKGRFLRGAIALAANGIPIFNPQNNRGEVSAEIGELDEWGGHCGRADDYHYHAAPLHLQDKVGKGRPIAVALDGYPIFGLTEADGSQPNDLDEFHGHSTAALGYHYHASTKYPYVNGGFHGEVKELGEQVDPQPSARPVRGAGAPLRGAKITDFAKTGDASYRLTYELASEKCAILYNVNADGSLAFEYQNGKAGTTKETYQRRDSGGGDSRPRPRPDQPEQQKPMRRGEVSPAVKPIGNDTIVSGLQLKSPAIDASSVLPIEFTGDGASISPPLAWSGTPLATKSYAVIMHHIDPAGQTKLYWTLYNIPSNVLVLPKNAKGVGIEGSNSINRNLGYAPPHSKGPGAKTYIITLYALSAPLDLSVPPAEVNRDVLLAAMKEKILGTSELKVTYTRDAAAVAAPVQARVPMPKEPIDPSMIKAAMSDTIKAEVYADNWFALYINGRLTVVDPIEFLPHNVVSVDILPEYPMTIAVIAHDNADPQTGLEYGNHIGDAGFILKFADGTVTDGTWKVKTLERGPINGDLKNPTVKSITRPENWYAINYDDSKWENATVYTEQQVNPKPPYYEHDFKSASFIWSKELALDNTVLFRKRIEKPGAASRWTAKPAGPAPQP